MDTLLQHSTVKSILKRHGSLVVSCEPLSSKVIGVSTILIQKQFQIATRGF